FKDLDLISHTSEISYDWETNRLQIKFVVYPKYKSLSKMPAKEICKKATSRVRETFGTDYEEDDIRGFISISRFFGHTGFTNKIRPANLMEEVENSTKIIIRVFANKTDKPIYKNIASSESPLMGKEVLFIATE
ncbi:hypothetical protein ACFL0Q_05970, partial [Thermodesulfobacteriota bacterium]